MKKYSVTTPWRLRELCIENDWFTSGDIRQYEKLFQANEEEYAITAIATIIWICSSDTHTRKDILQKLLQEKYGK